MYFRLKKGLAMKGHQSKSSILSAKGYRMPFVFPMREGDRNEMAQVEGVNSVSERVKNVMCISNE